ncbi:hypothetical protein GCM10027280_41110 [Micromonospora polyrhachis]
MGGITIFDAFVGFMILAPFRPGGCFPEWQADEAGQRRETALARRSRQATARWHEVTTLAATGESGEGPWRLSRMSH